MEFKDYPAQNDVLLDTKIGQSNMLPLGVSQTVVLSEDLALAVKQFATLAA